MQYRGEVSLIVAKMLHCLQRLPCYAVIPAWAGKGITASTQSLVLTMSI